MLADLLIGHETHAADIETVEHLLHIVPLVFDDLPVETRLENALAHLRQPAVVRNGFEL